MFVVAGGEVAVDVARPDGGSVRVGTLSEGEFFGEFGMFTDGRRHASVVALEGVDVLEIGHADLVAVGERHPRVREVLRDFYRRRALDTALAASRLFGHTSPDVRERLSAMCAEERHQEGSTVLQEGDDGAGLYLVKRGRLTVRSQDLSGAALVLAELGPGDFFGEISVLSSTPITADVVAEEPTEVLKFSRREVVEICTDHPEVREALEATRSQRLHESIERLGETGVV